MEGDWWAMGKERDQLTGYETLILLEEREQLASMQSHLALCPTKCYREVCLESLPWPSTCHIQDSDPQTSLKDRCIC